VPCSRSGLSWHDETFSRAGDGCFFSSSIVVWGRNHLEQLPLFVEMFENGSLEKSDTLNSDDFIFVEPLNVNSVYSIYLTDTIGCRLDSSFQAEMPTGIGRLEWAESRIEVRHTCSLENKGEISIPIARSGFPNSGMGDFPVEIEWSHGPAGIFDRDNTEITRQENLSPGIYTVTASNTNCTITREFEILDIPQFELQPQIREPSCGGFDGSIQLILDPPGAYTFEWINFASDTTEVLSDLGAGSYEVTVWDSLGCNKTERIVVAGSEQLALSVVHQSSADCQNGGLSTTTIAPNYISGLSLEYEWSTGDRTDGIETSLAQLSPGDYWVVATNQICASDTLFFAVTSESSSIDIDSLLISPPTCSGDLGAIEVSSSAVDLQYEIDGMTYTDPTIDGLVAGDYELLIRDTSGCSTTRSFTIPEVAPFEITIDSTQSEFVACSGDSVAIMIISSTAFSLTTLDGIAVNSGDSYGPGSHELIGVNDEGCADTITFNIDEVSIDIGDIGLLPVQLCADETFGFIPTSLFDNGESSWTFILDGTSYQLDDFIELGSGSFSAEIITDEACVETLMITIAESDLDISAPMMISGSVGDTLLIELAIRDPNRIDQVNWTSVNDQECLDVLCTELNIVAGQSETVSYEIVDTLGCVFSGSIELEAIPLDSMMMDTTMSDTMTMDTMMNMMPVDSTTITDPPIIDTTQQLPTQPLNTNYYLPNAIRVGSPVNGNLCVHVATDGFISGRINVYDRWGGLVAQVIGPLENRQLCIPDPQIWEELAVGVYVYSVELISAQMEIRDHGSFTLVR